MYEFVSVYTGIVNQSKESVLWNVLPTAATIVDHKIVANFQWLYSQRVFSPPVYLP